MMGMGGPMTMGGGGFPGAGPAGPPGMGGMGMDPGGMMGMGMPEQRPRYFYSAGFSGDPDFEGLLCIQDTFNKMLWKPREAVLKDNVLYLFKPGARALIQRHYPRPASHTWNVLRTYWQKSVKTIALEYAEVQVAEGATGRPCTFSLFHKNPAAPDKWFFGYFLSCESYPELATWIERIKKCKISALKTEVSKKEVQLGSGVGKALEAATKAEREHSNQLDEQIEAELEYSKAVDAELKRLQQEIDQREKEKKDEEARGGTRGGAAGAAGGRAPPSAPVEALNAAPSSSAARDDFSFPVPAEYDNMDYRNPGGDPFAYEAGGAYGDYDVGPGAGGEYGDEESDEGDYGGGGPVSSQILVYEVEEDDDNIIGEVIASEGDLIGQLREKVGVELELGNSFLMELNGILLQHELDGAAIGPYLQQSNVLIIQ